ncbi:MAG: phospholipase D-like domain-containing protein [Thermodesulfobacteriota bacterium]
MAKIKYTVLLLVFSCLMFTTLPRLAKAENLNINTATETELTSLPYIGTIRARTIIACRDTHGPFKAFKELLICDGIGPDTVKIMRADLAITANPEQPSPSSQQDEQGKDPARIKTSQGDVVVLTNADYFPALLNKIRGAQANIDLAMFVFKTTKSSKNRPSLIIKELIAAAQWGVQVRVFLEKSGYDEKLNATNQLTARRLRDNGIKVIFDSPNITTHTKLVIIDRRYSFVGSHNFTNAALKYNNEVSLLVDDQNLAQKLTVYMEGIISP